MRDYISEVLQGDEYYGPFHWIAVYRNVCMYSFSEIKEVSMKSLRKKGVRKKECRKCKKKDLWLRSEWVKVTVKENWSTVKEWIY
jgi:hypothetical protein